MARRIQGVADDIAAFLPKELGGAVTSVPEPAESFGLDEFVRRAAEREHVDRDTAYDNRAALDLHLREIDMIKLEEAFPPPTGPRPLDVL